MYRQYWHKKTVSEADRKAMEHERQRRANLEWNLITSADILPTDRVLLWQFNETDTRKGEFVIGQFSASGNCVWSQIGSYSYNIKRLVAWRELPKQYKPIDKS